MFSAFLIVYIVLLGLIIFVLSRNDRNAPEGEKYLDEITAKVFSGILISVVLSFVISSSADIPEGAGLGGLAWLFGPLFFGAISVFLYLFTLALFKKTKVGAGIVCVIFNIGVGVYFYFLP
ncbi:hypothetical protein [Roseivirga pacifica]|uniref:hypothetical protein n=1 Tax=Roseivirga pacifica TaxID=1267423 RepID=UPI003BAAFEB4